MVPEMKKNFTKSTTDGSTMLPKYTKEGLGEEHGGALVTTIRDWLKIHLCHLGTRHRDDLYITAIREDCWKVMDVVDTDKEDTIRDNINMSGKTTLTNPMIIDLAETADETNLELSKVEAAPRRKSSTEMERFAVRLAT